MTMTRSASSASFMWWVMSTTVMPLLPVQLVNGGQHLLPADGVQHGGGLVQHDALRLHGDDAGDGDPLLLTAGEQMGRVAS